MLIFMDESGSLSGFGKMPSPSVVGCLVVPDHTLEGIERRYRRLRLPKASGEVKGRLLDEAQVAEVVSILRTGQAFFEATMIELGAHTEDEIIRHRDEAALSITRNLPSDAPAPFREAVFRHRDQLRTFSPQLHVQSSVTFDLLMRVLEHSTVYHSQRNPKALAAFHWVVDSKDRGLVTPWEEWWRATLQPFVQARSLTHPTGLLIGGDYTHFRRFLQDVPQDLAARYEGEAGRTEGTKLSLIFGESFRFSDAPEAGLELVDILTNGLRRALKGNLGPSGWQAIRSLCCIACPAMSASSASTIASTDCEQRPMDTSSAHSTQVVS